MTGRPIPPLDPSDAGGALVVTSMGGIAVATDELLAHIDRLRRLLGDLADDLARTEAADGTLPGFPLGETLILLRRLSRLAGATCDGIVRATEGYADLEQRVIDRQHQLAAIVAAQLGPVLRWLTLLGLASAPLLVVAGLAGWALIPDRGDGRLAEARRWFLAHPELVTSPEFVRAVRLAVTSLDEAALTGLGMPPTTAIALGDEGTGFFGVESNAAGVMTVGALVGLFRETPVRVERVATLTIETGPTGARERLERIPEGDQVRIERYEAPGEPSRYIVYVGPTETFSPRVGSETWDLTSNVAGVAGLSAGSFRATELAMAEAGVKPGDAVQFIGFSQGGLVATLLAASGNWNAVGLETYGAPAGNIELPGGLAGMAVRNTDDFIPALAGPQYDHHLLQVEREAFAGDRPLPTDVAAPAHQRSAYTETAAAIDDAESTAVLNQIDRMDAFTAEYTGVEGAKVTVMTYHGERIEPAATSSRG